jgi:cell division septum initiation protein DivIVA
MGIAAYNRGSLVAAAQIGRDDVASRNHTLLADVIDENVQLRARVAELERELGRARRSIASLRATLAIERADRRQ